MCIGFGFHCVAGGWGNLMKIYENVSRSANAYLEVLPTGRTAVVCCEQLLSEREEIT